MSLQEFPSLIQGSDEWHAQRRGMITASVIGRLVSVRPAGPGSYDCAECGAEAEDPCISKVSAAPIKTLHNTRGPASPELTLPPVLGVATGNDARGLTALLAAERITGYTDPTYINDDMLRGIEDEPLAVDVYSEHFAPVTTTGFMVRDDYGFNLGYSPDGLVGDDGLVEVKSRRQKTQLLTVISEQGVPDENMAQLQCGLLVSGRQWIDYISYSGGMALWVKRITPDPRWFEAILAAAEAFEKSAAQMLAAYRKATEGLPITERTTDLEMVI